MHPTVLDRLQMRAYARGIGDRGLEHACNADLARYGYRDEELVPAVPGDVETTEHVEPGLEHATPEKPKRRGRPPRPRCEHDNIVGRCAACDEEEIHV